MFELHGAFVPPCPTHGGGGGGGAGGGGARRAPRC
eukprot:COSAG04_NODE_1117_length_8197_cov_19.090258_1_plen_34_part_10